MNNLQMNEQKLLSTLLKEIDMIIKHQIALNLNDYEAWVSFEEMKQAYKYAANKLLAKKYPNTKIGE